MKTNKFENVHLLIEPLKSTKSVVMRSRKRAKGTGLGRMAEDTEKSVGLSDENLV